MNDTCKVLFAALVLLWISVMYFPDPMEASISNGSISGNLIVTGGVGTLALPGNTTLNIQSSGSQTPVLGGENITTQFCIPFATATTARLNCTSGFTFNNSGAAQLTNSAAPIFSLINSGANQNAFFEWQNASGRQWLFGTGLPSSASTGLAYAEYTNGVFQQITFYLKKGGTTCIGKGNSECTTNTLDVKDATASTGATRFQVELGAADTVDTTTETNAGRTSAARYVTATNCSSSASPAVCGTAAAGSVTIAAGATTVTVNTTAVTANSQINVLPDSSLGTKLSVTCNALATITNFDPAITARTAGTSFTISITGPVAVNPACFNYTIVN